MGPIRSVQNFLHGTDSMLDVRKLSHCNFGRDNRGKSQSCYGLVSTGCKETITGFDLL
jgi:hypothetical protein